MKDIEAIKQSLRDLFAGQYFLVLATRSQPSPHTSLVAFASDDNLEWFFFATQRSTQKFVNIVNDCHVSLLVDNRGNDINDLAYAMAVTVTGLAQELPATERESALPFFLTKHPEMTDFVQSPHTVFVKVKVLTYRIVTQFQNVVTLNIADSP